MNSNPYKIMTNKFPSAKTDSIVVQELPDELFIYNLQTNKAVCLNASTAFVWKHCDGKTDLRQLTPAFNQHFSTEIDENFIGLVLDDLLKADLIENHSIKFSDSISRRKALLNYALPMAMLPIVSTLIAPTAAQAQSAACSDPTAPASCLSDSDCSSLPITCNPGCICSYQCQSNCCIFQEACM